MDGEGKKKDKGWMSGEGGNGTESMGDELGRRMGILE